jgi:two-component system, NtrC family, response regulator GlrR
VSAVALTVSSASWANRATGRRTRTVLLVDDDPALRLVCRVNLELEGFVALEAASGDEALGLLEREPVGLVVLDQRLEGDLDGVTVARVIRAEHSEVAVVGLTGVVPPPEEFAAYLDEVLVKPFDLEALAHAARRLCLHRK